MGLQFIIQVVGREVNSLEHLVDERAELGPARDRPEGEVRGGDPVSWRGRRVRSRSVLVGRARVTERLVRRVELAVGGLALIALNDQRRVVLSTTRRNTASSRSPATGAVAWSTQGETGPSQGPVKATATASPAGAKAARSTPAAALSSGKDTLASRTFRGRSRLPLWRKGHGRAR